MSEPKHVRLNMKEAAVFFTKSLEMPVMPANNVNERVGKRAAELLVEILAVEMAQSNYQRMTGRSLVIGGAMPPGGALPPGKSK